MAPLTFSTKVHVTMLSRQSDVYHLLGCTGIILLNFLEPWATINPDCYIKTLIKQKAKIACTKSEKTFFLQYDNARPYMSLKITECVTKFSWTVLPHPPYKPDLAPSDFYLFGPVKEGLQRQHFVDNNAVLNTIKKWTTTDGRVLPVQHTSSHSSLKKMHKNGGD